MFPFLRKESTTQPSPAAASPEPTEDSRAALLDRIHALEEKNQLVETRFRDVVGAYKALIKEKEVLERSIAAATKTISTPAKADTRRSEPPSESAAAETDVPESTPAADAEVDQSKLIEELQARIATLTDVVSTITQERASMTALFQADKKAAAEAHRAALETATGEMQAKIAVIEHAAAEQRDSLQAELARRGQQILTLQEADASRQAAWERERAMHSEDMSAMMRQQTHGDGLASRVRELETRLQQARDGELNALGQLSETTAALKARLAAQEEELADVRTQLAASMRRGESDELLRVKQELRVARKAADAFRDEARMAVQQQNAAIRAAQERVDQADQSMALMRTQLIEAERAAQEQKLVAESRTAELSTTLGLYEATRREDLQTIAALRERVAELEAAEAPPPQASPLVAQQAAQIATLQDKVAQLKALLKASALRVGDESGPASNPVTPGSQVDTDIENTVDVAPPPWHGKPIPEDIEPAVLQARTETLAYFRAVQTIAQQLTGTRRQLASYQKQLTSASSRASIEPPPPPPQFDTSAAELRAAQVEIEHLKDSHAKAVEELTVRYTQLRDRTTELIRDKDSEITRLRRAVQGSSSDGFSSGPEGAAMHSGAPLVHFSTLEMQLARERDMFRQRLKELELAVSDAEEAKSLIAEQVGALKAEIRRLERSASRDGANLEYLKNIMVKYLQRSIPRERVLPAIAKILQFSPEETKAIMNS
eukprot:m.58468 g.58468  ORF g.58468 m.58468 type:complete len:723 (+) comp6903_c0_seq2:72-2240(+)